MHSAAGLAFALTARETAGVEVLRAVSCGTAFRRPFQTRRRALELRHHPIPRAPGAPWDTPRRMHGDLHHPAQHAMALGALAAVGRVTRWNRYRIIPAMIARRRIVHRGRRGFCSALHVAFGLASSVVVVSLPRYATRKGGREIQVIVKI